nr:hypothetical protein [Tanacetum cinerariifolium]
MEGSPFKKFRGDKHMGMLIMGKGTLQQLREKLLLSEALESRVHLDLEQLAFLVDNKDTVLPAQASQEIPNPIAFQTDDLHAFDSDSDDVPLAKAVLMANLSSYDSDVLSESTQTMHMLTKPQEVYDETHKTALGYQNPFYLSQARWKVPSLYDGNTIVKTHVALSVTDSEDTLELAEESRLKMLAKQNDPSLKEKKVKITPIDYVALNKLSEHFLNHFVPQKQLSAEQTYWLPISQPVVIKPPVPSEPVLKKEIPRKLLSISFVKDSFHKMKEHVKKLDETNFAYQNN